MMAFRTPTVACLLIMLATTSCRTSHGFVLSSPQHEQRHSTGGSWVTSHVLCSMAGDADVHFDLAIVGGGVVGVQAAMTAASAPLNKKVCLIDAPRASGMLMNEATGEDLSLGAPTGLFSKALRDTSKTIKVASLRGMGLREER